MEFFKQYVHGGIVLIITILWGLLTFKEKRNAKLREEKKVIQRQLDNAQHTGNIKQFEALQDLLKEKKEHDENNGIKLNPNTKYRL